MYFLSLLVMLVSRTALGDSSVAEDYDTELSYMWHPQ